MLIYLEKKKSLFCYNVGVKKFIYLTQNLGCRTVTEQQPNLKFHTFCYILLSAHLIVYVHKKFSKKKRVGAFYAYIFRKKVTLL